MSKITEVKKISRLYALYDSKMDKIGDIKYIKVYEIIKFRIKQKNRYIHKIYYNLLYQSSYKFISYNDEINRYKKLYNYYKNQSPFIIEVEIMSSDELSPLKQYHNNTSKKYFNTIKMNRLYDTKKAHLLQMIKDINISKIDDIYNMIYFEL